MQELRRDPIPGLAALAAPRLLRGKGPALGSLATLCRSRLDRRAAGRSGRQSSPETTWAGLASGAASAAGRLTIIWATCSGCHRVSSLSIRACLAGEMTADAAGAAAGWHLHAQLWPPYRTRDRLKYLAGTELAAGLFAMDVLPEATARELQAIDVSGELR